MDAKIEQSRVLRQAVLRVLYVHDESGLAIGYTAAELANLAAPDSLLGSDADRVAGYVRELLDQKLIRRVEDTSPPRVLISAAGRDFCRAEFPWSEVDRFTGGQRH